MDRLKLILLGMLIAFAVMILTGATGADGPGRYQLAGAGGTAFYVLDTHTGKIHTAGGGMYGAGASSSYGTNDNDAGGGTEYEGLASRAATNAKTYEN